MYHVIYYKFKYNTIIQNKTIFFPKCKPKEMAFILPLSQRANTTRVINKGYKSVNPSMHIQLSYIGLVRNVICKPLL